jgi:hypothetical protein
MTEYVVKLAFWLRAWDSVTIEAKADAEAIHKAKAAAKRAMESRVIPESIDTGRRFVRRVAAMPTGEPGPTTAGQVGFAPWRALAEEARRLVGPDP